MSEFKEYLFTYGTLKTGQENHDHIKSEDSMYVGEYNTKEKYEMHSWNDEYPGLLKNPVSSISGQLFIIKSKKLMDYLDEFKELGIEYTRELTSLIGFKHPVWIYAWIGPQDKFIKDTVRINQEANFCTWI